MLTIGCHLSASDGFLAMGRTALDIGANTFQFFTRNPRGSKAKAIDPDDAAALLALLKIARIATGHGKSDNWVDLAGYAACGGELQSRPAVCGK